nr:serine protease 44-like [Leptinotarsa decemlineata]
MIPKGVVVDRTLEKPFGYRILGNTNTEFAEFPWMLGILEDKTYRCGASLIHPQVALTAAHCLSGNGPFTIRAGEWNWKSKDEPVPHQNRKAEKILIHPNFHPASLRNDIALIVLDAPFQLMQNVGLICLPRQGTVFEQGICIAAGWGKNSHKKGTYQPILQKVSLPIVPRDNCVKSLRTTVLGAYFTLHQSFICAGGEEGRDTCKGDGGSPLMCPVKGTSDKYQQVGIVSWGFTCGQSNIAGVYVNLALFKDWIDFTLSAHGFNGAIERSGKRSKRMMLLNRTMSSVSV